MNKNIMDRLDPELVGPVRMNMKLAPANLHDIPGTRAIRERMTAEAKKQSPIIEGVTAVDRMVPGPTNAPDVFVRIYRPKNSPDMLPAFLWIQGGGYVLGSVEAGDLQVRRMTLATDCVIASVEYRRAPENPFSAAIEDCYAALKWLASNTGELGIDKSRIAIGGGSAGGGLAASLALLARDRAETNITFQLLIYPMIDDKNVTQASAIVPDTIPWSRESNLLGWQAYLGSNFGKKTVSPYAAAFRAKDLTGLPPAYIAVGELDLFLKEDITYAQRLINANVPTELHIYLGACHGFYNTAPNAKISKRFVTDMNDALKRAL
jgi:acetyl esterase/lipase